MEILRTTGWDINENQAAEFFENEQIPKNAQEVLINKDLREFGNPTIINSTSKKQGLFETPCVLQIMKFRNVCLPKLRDEFGNNDQKAGIYRVFLTDGHATISSVFLDPISGIGQETPPGTKILLTGDVPLEGNFITFSKSNVKVLGGKVEQLIEKWKVERDSLRAEGFKSKKEKSVEGAPKWVSFGKRNGNLHQKDVGFKANDAIQTAKKPENEDDDFSKHREQVLNELKTETKVFAKPNVEQKPKPKPQNVEKVEKQPKIQEGPKKAPSRRRKNSEDDDGGAQKPAPKATLFDFLNDVVGPVEKVQRPPSNFEPDQRKGQGTSGPRRDERNNRTNFENRKGNEQNTRRNTPNNEKPRGFQSNRDQNNDRNRGNRNFEQDQRKPNQNRNEERNPRNKPAFTINENVEQNNRKNNFQAENRKNPGTSNQFRNNTDHQNRQGGFRESNRAETAVNRQNSQNQGASKRPNRYDNSAQQVQRDFERINISAPPVPSPNLPQWRVGTKCLAPWEDGRLYPATVVELYPDRMCAIRYDQYGNVITIPVDVLIYA